MMNIEIYPQESKVYMHRLSTAGLVRGQDTLLFSVE